MNLNRNTALSKLFIAAVLVGALTLLLYEIVTTTLTPTRYPGWYVARSAKPRLQASHALNPHQPGSSSEDRGGIISTPPIAQQETSHVGQDSTERFAAATTTVDPVFNDEETTKRPEGGSDMALSSYKRLAKQNNGVAAHSNGEGSDVAQDLGSIASSVIPQEETNLNMAGATVRNGNSEEIPFKEHLTFSENGEDLGQNQRIDEPSLQPNKIIIRKTANAQDTVNMNVVKVVGNSPSSGAEPTRNVVETGLQQGSHNSSSSGGGVDLGPLLAARTNYLLLACIGRLGNSLFELAAASCMAELNNLTLVVRRYDQLDDLDLHGVVQLGDEYFKEFKTRLQAQMHVQALCCEFQNRFMRLEPAGRSHIISGYFQSWHYFEPCKERVKREVVRFNNDTQSKAQAVLDSLRKTYPGRILVGVHVRLEDYLLQRAIDNGKVTAPPEYYRKAMDYFRNRLHNVTFAVITAKVKTFRAVVTSAPDVTFLQRSDSAAVDLEVLSGLDHVIVSVGTFGWWAGYRSRGTVVCYKDFFVPGTTYGKQFANGTDHFFYPGWVAL